MHVFTKCEPIFRLHPKQCRHFTLFHTLNSISFTEHKRLYHTQTVLTRYFMWEMHKSTSYSRIHMKYRVAMCAIQVFQFDKADKKRRRKHFDMTRHIFLNITQFAVKFIFSEFSISVSHWAIILFWWDAQNLSKLTQEKFSEEEIIATMFFSRVICAHEILFLTLSKFCLFRTSNNASNTHRLTK